MRKIKTIFIAAVASMTAVSCQTRLAPERKPAGEHTIVFSAVQPETKTSVVEGESEAFFLWDESDKGRFHVFENGVAPLSQTVSFNEDRNIATVTATFAASEASEFSYTAWVASDSGRQVPYRQTVTDGAYDPAADVLVADAVNVSEVPEALTFVFNREVALSKITFKGIGAGEVVEFVTLTSDSQDLADGRSVYLSGPISSSAFFATKPVENQTLTVRVVTDKATYCKTLSGKVTLGRNSVARFGVDLTGCQVTPTSGRTYIKLLCIGNSFSVDAMEYLYPMLRQAGYASIYIGNLYIGGCSLSTHWSNLSNNTSAYTFYTNGTNSWSSTTSSANAALSGHKWDYVSIQQVSQDSGRPETFEPYLGNIIGKVKELCPGAKIIWHMTWAYQSTSSYQYFVNYHNDQMEMYDAILDAVRTGILPRNDFSLVVPTGTAIQNLRTSMTGDNLNRDGFHLSYGLGRYTAALMWAKSLGADIDLVSYTPESYPLSPTQTAAAKEAVENAYAHPFEITKSSYGPAPYEPNEDLRQAFVNAGYDLSKYREVELEIHHRAYYNSTSNASLVCAESGSTASNLSQFAATQIFRKHDIPVGSVIIQKSGFQYRPEGWTALQNKNASGARPANVTTQIVLVDNAWWGSWNYRAFNLAKSGNPSLDDAGQAQLERCFAIFAPVE